MDISLGIGLAEDYAGGCVKQVNKDAQSERWCVMSFKWDRVHVWSCEITDQPGSVAAKLSFLAQADANLEYIFTKRLPNKPGFGVLYVAPVTGPAQVRAAKAADMHEVDAPVVRRIEGDNETGLGHRVTQQWAKAGISL